MAGPLRRALTSAEEQAFQRDMATDPAYRQWANTFFGRFGEQPDISPGGNYDYRSAWLYGVKPQPYAPDGGFPHWPSVVEAPPFAKPLDLKSPDHPTMWKERYMEKFGANPDELDLPAALARLFVPQVR